MGGWFAQLHIGALPSHITSTFSDASGFCASLHSKLLFWRDGGNSSTREEGFGAHARYVHSRRNGNAITPNDIRTIQQILTTATFERKQPTGPLQQPSRKKGLVKQFKIAMKASRETHAMEYLRTRTLTTWSAAPTYTWMQALTNLHPRPCGPIPRYALLRWTIGGESDCWFWRHFHKLGPCICGCGRLADTYPYGLAQAPLAEHHYAEYLNPAAHIHPDYNSVAQVVLPPQTYCSLQSHQPSEAARAYPAAYYACPSIGPSSCGTCPCVLCGKGDNCVDHWMRHCIVLPMTLLLLIGTKALQGVEQIAPGPSYHGRLPPTQNDS